jgi:drug/metabolite transporter (DMT)-like permease
MNAAAVGTALGAAICFGVAMVLQYRASSVAPQQLFLRPQLLGHLLTRPVWLVGVALSAVGLALHVAALALGSLAVVQPLLVSGLLFALPLAAVLDHRPLSWRQWTWAAVAIASLAAFLVSARPSAGRGGLDIDHATPVLIPAALLLVAVVIASRGGRPARRGVLLGVATGIGYAFVDVLIKDTVHIGLHHSTSVLTSWQIYVLLVAGVVSILLNQSAFNVGPIGPALAGISVVHPLLSVAIGATGFHEHLAAGALARTVESLALVLLVVGVVQVTQVDPEHRPRPA